MAHSLFPDLTASTLLPPFRTLLITGCYPPSAPIHLALSHLSGQNSATGILRKKQRVLLITPSRGDFSSRLEAYNDERLNAQSGHGQMTHLLSKIDILYAPTPAHLTLLLSMLHIPSATPPLSENIRDPKVALHDPPSLVILHELGSYFSSSEAREAHTLSEYVALVANALSALQYLSIHQNDPDPRLVLFDSGVRDLRLPLLKPLPSQDLLMPEDYGESSSRKERVFDAVKRYFEWVGDVELLEYIPSSRSSPFEIPMDIDEDEDGAPEPLYTSKTHRMTLVVNPSIRRSGQHTEPIVWEWAEKAAKKVPSRKRGVVIVWE
ncbi:hypothetical protein BOTBODRAFT_183713 [Botryobasidium botryosum FD-172 SS1]|uniref:Uncharacterized protein n=1 Tax=Botryobasidium botryosum (strain FD-172 SS1) TaxID=930990 RepID=A0A067MZ70_BOTB1|nr:hypothetical protein BOTBODRAFT_183713 [Botryobasidium botryosum FD-172 SS1]